MSIPHRSITFRHYIISVPTARNVIECQEEINRVIEQCEQRRRTHDTLITGQHFFNDQGRSLGMFSHGHIIAFNTTNNSRYTWSSKFIQYSSGRYRIEVKPGRADCIFCLIQYLHSPGHTLRHLHMGIRDSPKCDGTHNMLETIRGEHGRIQNQNLCTIGYSVTGSSLPIPLSIGGTSSERQSGYLQNYTERTPQAIPNLATLRNINPLMMEHLRLSRCNNQTDYMYYLQRQQMEQLTCNPLFESSFRNCLELQKIYTNSFTWMECLETFSHIEHKQGDLQVAESVEWIRKIFKHNNEDLMKFVAALIPIMDKTFNKINSVLFLGPPNGGKTLIAESIARTCIFYINIQNFEKGNNFYLQDLVNMRCGLINEPHVCQEKIETFKNICEGLDVAIDVKYKTAQILKRTPLIITSNHELALNTLQIKDNTEALNKRMIKIKLKQFGELEHCKGRLNPNLWMELYNEYLSSMHIDL